MKKIFSVALGILAAIGGFVDMGDLVFNAAAGATFGYELLWVVVVGVVGIITYSEMCGRVAAVSKRAVFDAVRERLGFKVGLVALVSAQFVNLLTLAAEVGGVAVVLRLLSGLPYRALIVLGVGVLVLVIWTLPFDYLERIFGYVGLCLIVFAVAAVKLEPDWGAVAHGFVPSAHTGDMLLYCYFVVGLLGAAMTPYEVYFYSSGAIEEGWTPRDLGTNKANAVIGYALGGFLSFALMISAGALLLPHGITPDLLGTSALMAQAPLGEIGLLLALVGMLFAVGGAALDVAFSGAYSLAQFLGWEWGKYRRAVRRAALHADVACPVRAGRARRPHRRRPGAGDGVLRDLLGGRAPADVRPDPARRKRPRVHGRLCERARRERLRRDLPHRDPRDRRLRGAAPLPHEPGAGMSRSIDLGLGLLDHQIVDSDGRRCGKVDDLELSGISEGRPVVTELLVGRRRRVHVPWEAVAKVDSAVHLKREAKELRLGRGEDRVRPWIERLPFS